MPHPAKRRAGPISFRFSKVGGKGVRNFVVSIFDILFSKVLWVGEGISNVWGAGVKGVL